MISLRLVVPAVAVSTGLAASFTYFVSPPQPIEAERRSVAPARDATVAGAPARVDQERSAEDFLRAAEAILRPLSSAQASARSDELPIMGHIPLPKRRPIPR
jgi:fructose-1-phosphate kinase PfkB-like protein